MKRIVALLLVCTLVATQHTLNEALRLNVNKFGPPNCDQVALDAAHATISEWLKLVSRPAEEIE